MSPFHSYLQLDLNLIICGESGFEANGRNKLHGALPSTGQLLILEREL